MKLIYNNNGTIKFLFNDLNLKLLNYKLLIKYNTIAYNKN